MGLFGLGKKKKDVNQYDQKETAEETVKPPLADEADEASDNNNNQDINKEDMSVAKKVKKICAYIAVDSKNNILLNKNEQPYIVTADEGSRIFWSDEIAEKGPIIDESLKVEIEYASSGERDKAKKTAQKKLRELAAERVEEARRLKYEKEKAVKEDVSVAEEMRADSPVIKESVTKDSITKESVTKDSVIKDFEDSKKFNQYEAEKPDKVFSKPEVREEKADKNAVHPEAADKNDVTKIINKISDVDGHIGTTGENNIRIIKSLISQIENQTVKICKQSNNAVNDAKDAIVSSVTQNQDEITLKVKSISSRVKELGESVECIEGKLSGLDKLDIITELLQNKGLTMSLEIPPVNADEEDILNLVRYSQKITEQLGYAARTLIRRQEAFTNQEKNNSNEQQAMNQRITVARYEGIVEGKLEFIRQLVAKFEDIDTIKDSDINHVHVIWTLLKELGAVIDGDGYYEKGKEIDFSEADIERLIGTYSKLEGAGKYKVVKTGLVFEGKIISKAVFEKISEEL